jgi:hypothetical protein
MVEPRSIVSGLVILAITVGLVGCGDRHGASVPSAPSAVLPQSGVTAVRGVLIDTAFRPLAGGRVEVIDGPETGKSATADGSGWFSLSGRFDDTTRFRATKEGHVAATETLLPNCASCPGAPTRWISFYLGGLTPPVSIAGDYTLTFIADRACAGLPDELRTRSFTVTITPRSDPRIPADTLFNATVSGASFLENRNGFPIGVAGDLIAFQLEDHGPYLVEQVAPNTYLAFDGRAEATVGTSGLSTISTSFDGLIEYCALTSPMGSLYSCGQAPGVGQCFSRNHRLILTRR